MGSVLLTAEPFGFGPAAKICTVARALLARPEIERVSVLGRGTVAELAELDQLPVIRYGLQGSGRVLIEALSSHDVVFSAMNFEVDLAVKHVGTPAIYLDTLFWLWEDDFWSEAAPTRYLCQNFPGVEQAIERWDAPFKSRMEVIGPVVDLRGLSQDREDDILLVSLGGFRSDFIHIGDNTDFPRAVLSRLLPAIRAHSKLPILVVSSAPVVASLAAQSWTVEDLRFTTLAQPRYLEQLARCKALFTTCGIEGAYEAFAYDTPVFFLPAVQHSHFHQHRILREAGAAAHGYEWRELLERGLEGLEPNPRAQVEHVLRVARAEGGTEAFAEGLRSAVSGFFTALLDPTPQLAAQAQFFASLGSDGVETCVARILAQVASGGAPRE